MLLGITSTRATWSTQKAAAMDVLRSHGGIPTGSLIGDQWQKSRFRSPYLRNTLWEYGYALDTLETAVAWSVFDDLRTATLAALDHSFRVAGVPLLRFSHLSHVYPDGASLYVTLLYPRRDDPAETLSIWQAAKHAASEAILNLQGTISHQHGLGVDHAPYLEIEIGSLGMRTLQAISRSLDPAGIMNPGKGWPDPAAG